MNHLKLHVSEEDIQGFHKNTLSPAESDALLTHTAHCSFCADRLAKSFEEQSFYRAPANLKEEILAKTQGLSMEPALSSFSKRLQWLFYSAKICAAMGLALFLLFSLPQADFAASPHKTAPDLAAEEPSFTEKLNQSLNQAAANINNQMNLFTSYYPIEEDDES